MRLSLVDLAKIVLACAVASLCITPGHRMAQYQGGTLIVVDAIIFALVLALFAFVFVRHGPRRTATVEILILWATGVALGFLIRGITTTTLPRVRAYGWRVIHAEDLILSLVGVILATLAGWLAFRLARRARGFIARRRPAG